MTKSSAGTIEPAGRDAQHELWKRLADLRVAMLTTRDVDGAPIARPVRPVQVDDGELWVFTAMDGGIAQAIRGDPQVHVSFVDQDEDLFVSLSGVAEVRHDPETARKFWSTMAGAWFPDGPDDANLAIVRIAVHRGDYWDVTDSKLVQFFKLATAAALNKRPDDIGTHRRFTA